MTECKGQHQQCSECWERNTDLICTLREENRRLREALEEHGTHGVECGYVGVGPDSWNCECGLDKAKEAQTDE